MAEGFFGGFAQGFASTYSRRSSSLADQLGLKRLELDERKFQYQQQTTEERNAIAERQLELQTDQAQSLNAHREWQQKFQTTQHELELRKTDLDIAGKLTSLLDSKFSPGARKAGIKMFAMSLGVDPKNPQFSAMTEMLSNLEQTEAEAIQNYIADFAPNAKPGEVKGIVQMMFTNPSTAMEMLKAVAEGPNVNMTPIIDPNNPDQSVMVRDADAIGQQPAPSGQYMSPEETLRLEEGKMIIAADQKKLEALQEKASQAKALSQQLQFFGAGLEAGNFTTGPFGNLRYEFGKLVQFFGLEDQIDMESLAAGGQEAAEIMNTSSGLIAAAYADMMGRTTNMQLGFIQEMIPGLLKSPEGNALIVESMNRAANRTLMANRIAEQYMSDYNSLRPKNKNSVWEEISRVELANPLVDDAFINKMREVSQDNQGVDLGKLFTEMAGIEIDDGIPDIPGLAPGQNPSTQFGTVPTDRSNLPADSRTLRIGPKGKEQQFPVTAFRKLGKKSFNFVEIESSGGSTEDVPVVWDIQDIDNIPTGTYFLYGPSGTLHGVGVGDGAK